MYRLHVDATGEWEGLTIRAFWHVPDGKDPASSLVVDGYVDVPASVTSQPGSGCLTFEGSDGTKTVTSADLRYRVSANSGTEDGTMPEPGTPAWQQLVNAVHTVATTAEQAKTDAQTAAQQAGQALSDTITAKEDVLKTIGDKQTSATTAVESAQGKALDAVTDAKNTATQAVDTVQANAIQQMELTKTDALKAIGDKQTAATQAVDTARDKAIKQVETSTQAAKTAASEAVTSAGSASQSAKAAAGSLQELKNGVANGDFKGEKGDPGPAVALDTTLTHEGEAADAKATGDAISAVKARQNILVGSEIGNPISVDDAFPAPLCGLTVYGKSTQDGTPTPDAPVPIVSAGESGSEVDLERGVKVQRVDKAAFDSTKPLAEQNAILATPIETPLTSDEIAAYKALVTYGPDTVVQAGDGAGVKLDYQRDVNIAIKKLEDAIASMTTT